ncbi:hypothetical protein H0H93_007183 [Arthromyces matolae]|nr:hypothetical protein H0H93_007183 [Arthromyces matolae]
MRRQRLSIAKVFTVSNPRFNISDIPAIAEVAHRHGVPLVVDNTFGACGLKVILAQTSKLGLPSHEELAKRLLNGFGSVLSFGFKGRQSQDHLKLHSHLTNLGSVHSLIVHPASTTHGELTEEEREAAGVTQDMLRVSVGTEHIDDILEDYELAVQQIQVDKTSEDAPKMMTEQPEGYLTKPDHEPTS